MERPESLMWMVQQEQGALYTPLEDKSWRQAFSEDSISEILFMSLKIDVFFWIVLSVRHFRHRVGKPGIWSGEGFRNFQCKWKRGDKELNVLGFKSLIDFVSALYSSFCPIISSWYSYSKRILKTRKKHSQNICAEHQFFVLQMLVYRFWFLFVSPVI